MVSPRVDAHPPDPATATIEGRVHRRGAPPACGATVLLDEQRAATTDGNGTFAFYEVCPGAHYLRVSQPWEDGVIAGVAQVRVPRPGETVHVEMWAEEAATLIAAIETPAELARGGQVWWTPAEPSAGLLAAARPAPAIPGRLAGRIRTDFGDSPFWSDSFADDLDVDPGGDAEIDDGTIEIGGLAPGLYHLTFYDGHIWRIPPVLLRPGENRLTLRLDVGGHIRGCVVDRSGAPVRAPIRMEPTDLSQTFWCWQGGCDLRGGQWSVTGPDGAFEVDHVPSGWWRIQALPSETTGGVEALLDVQPSGTYEVRLEVGPVRTVHAVMGGLELSAYGPPGIEWEYGPLGEHLYRGITDSCPTLVVGWSPPDYVAIARLDGTADVVDGTGGSAAVVTGVVVDTSGRPVGAGAQVLFHADFMDLPDAVLPPASCLWDPNYVPPACDPTWPIVTDIDGHFGPVLLSPAEWRIEVPGGESITVLVGLGETHDITLHLP